METGDWIMSLTELLNSSVWSEGVAVNEALLKHVQNLVEQVGESKTGAARQEFCRLNSPHWRRLEQTITRYLNRFLVHIKGEDLYVVKRLQYSSTISYKFQVYQANRFKAAFQASTYCISI